MTTYAVYRKSSGEHFYNATQQSYNQRTTEIAQIGHDCVYVGDLDTAQRMVESANARMPQTSFNDLLL